MSAFKLELILSRLADSVSVEDSPISDQLLDQAWQTMSDCIIDILDSLGEEPTDERFREIFIETCYRLIFREMFTLNAMPVWEESWKERLGTRRTGIRLYKKGSYDDSDWNKEDS